nr:ADM_HP1_G0029150.mRNA.1.CDS.1 [Saccharomyces cerevisiae]
MCCSQFHAQSEIQVQWPESHLFIGHLPVIHSEDLETTSYVGHPINTSLYTLKATVVGKTKRAFQTREVTKRRNRRVRHAKSKGDLTILRISELSMN